MLMQREKSLLLIVDLQERLLPVVEGAQQAIKEVGWLGELAQQLDVPVWLTEQNPQGLGATDMELRKSLPGAICWEKTHFNAYAEPKFAQTLAESGRQQIVLCGAEAHICVLQTALGLSQAGYQVYWLAEATCSRRPAEANLARRRAELAGAVVVSVDMVIYEWLERCNTALFKQIHCDWLKERAARCVPL